IGIATLNIFQRNYILDLIRKRSDEDINFSNKISALEQVNGEELFVKNLENIQGDQRDIIIISTTFGVREDGNFLQNYGPINQHKGFRLLNVIITRAKHKVFVFTSIPESYISQYSELISVNGNTGRGIFYAYLSYAKAVSSNNSEKKKAILELVSTSAFNDHNFNITES